MRVESATLANNAIAGPTSSSEINIFPAGNNWTLNLVMTDKEDNYCQVSFNYSQDIPVEDISADKDQDYLNLSPQFYHQVFGLKSPSSLLKDIVIQKVEDTPVVGSFQ